MNDTKEIEKLLAQQTTTILDVVDKKLEKTTEEFKQEINDLKISIDKFVGLPQLSISDIDSY